MCARPMQFQLCPERQYLTDVLLLLLLLLLFAQFDLMSRRFAHEFRYQMGGQKRKSWA